MANYSKLSCIYMWESFGAFKIWQIAIDKANGEKYIDELDDKLSLYLCVFVGKILANCPSLTPSNFPGTVLVW